MDLKEDHSHFPEQDPVNITMADIQVKVSRMKTWTAPDLDIIDSYQLWVTALHEHLVTLSNSDEPAAER